MEKVESARMLHEAGYTMRNSAYTCIYAQATGFSQQLLGVRSYAAHTEIREPGLLPPHVESQVETICDNPNKSVNEM